MFCFYIYTLFISKYWIIVQVNVIDYFRLVHKKTIALQTYVYSSKDNVKDTQPVTTLNNNTVTFFTNAKIIERLIRYNRHRNSVI